MLECFPVSQRIHLLLPIIVISRLFFLVHVFVNVELISKMCFHSQDVYPVRPGRRWTSWCPGWARLHGICHWGEGMFCAVYKFPHHPVFDDVFLFFTPTALSLVCPRRPFHVCFAHRDMIGRTGMVDSFNISLSASFVRKKRPFSSWRSSHWAKRWNCLPFLCYQSCHCLINSPPDLFCSHSFFEHCKTTLLMLYTRRGDLENAPTFQRA